MVSPLTKLWADRCTIEHVAEYTKANGAKAKEWNVLAADESCKISYFNNTSNNATATPSATAAMVTQQAKLFIRQDLHIPTGCRITVVTSENVTQTFENSGIPAYFTHHQEIMLEVKQQWA